MGRDRESSAEGARDALVELGGRVCAGLSEVLGAEGFLRAKVLG